MPIEITIQDDISYCGNEPGSIGEAIVKRVFNNENLEATLGITIREDVVVREKMLHVHMAKYITRKRAGCGERTNSGRPIFREKYLDVVNAQIWDEICAEDFGGTVAELARKKGYDVNNLQDTEIEAIYTDLYTNIWERDFSMIVQFGDTDIVVPAKPAADADEALKLAYAKAATLSITDGFWKLVFAGVANRAADANDPDGIIRAVEIPAGALPANYTRDVLLPALYDGQSLLMDQVEDGQKLIVLSRSLYQNLSASMRNFTTTGEASNGFFKDGAGNLSYEGVPIVKNTDIEQEVDTFKRRAYLTVKGGFQVGTDTHQQSQVMEGWYSKDTDLNNVRVRYKVGMQYMDGDVVIVAY
ncbi:hypothetical protein [Hymenobacter lapidiphilus]|uniref:Phage major capsid protein n=1 Tax=Hymenobacter lapidiphilus TaxID=2608003 RepID=A0A7Y7PSY9_9BACT|nr:hypothetical protein [Hymenobacter lapidiphilus]NVO33277.1 hypothetical protein [Hymenobacter lapidiphilus]